LIEPLDVAGVTVTLDLPVELVEPVELLEPVEPVALLELLGVVPPLEVPVADVPELVPVPPVAAVPAEVVGAVPAVGAGDAEPVVAGVVAVPVAGVGDVPSALGVEVGVAVEFVEPDGFVRPFAPPEMPYR
jgi:hypothetical protein